MAIVFPYQTKFFGENNLLKRILTTLTGIEKFALINRKQGNARSIATYIIQSNFNKYLRLQGNFHLRRGRKINLHTWSKVLTVQIINGLRGSRSLSWSWRERWATTHYWQTSSMINFLNPYIGCSRVHKSIVILFISY